MAWRLARSIETLNAEIEQVAPGTRVGTIGDEFHEPPSRHLPGPEGRVRAADVHGNAGLDLDELVETVTTAPHHPAVWYVIYRDRAWSPRAGWHDYGGAWHSHVHIAVSNEQADDTSPWGLLEEDDMDQGDIVRHTNLNVGTHLRWTLRGVQTLEAGQKAILAQLAGEDVAEAAEAAARAGARSAVREEFATLGPALAEQLGDVPAERIEQALRAVLGSLDEEGDPS